MPGKSKKPESIGNILIPFLKRTGLSWRIKEQKIIENWEKIVGREIAQNAQASRLRGGVLYVRVSNPIWMQQLQFLKEVIIKKIHQEIKEVVVDDLRLFIGKIDYSPSDRLAATQENDEENTLLKKKQEISAFISKEIAEKIGQIRDPEMRQLLSSLYSKNKQGKSSKI